MILCLDVGNTHIFGGIMDGKEIKLRFRHASTYNFTSDTIGLFLVSAIRENGFDPKIITAICISSVVPSLSYSITSACKKYFSISPIEVKQGTKSGIKLDVKNPHEVGADRIANAVAATDAYPDKNIIIMDFGTATTFCAISKNKAFMGGAILPGIKLSMQALANNTSKLAAVNIIRCENALGKTTETNIQAGLYLGQLGAAKEIINRLKATTFKSEDVVIIATGGYAHLFKEENLFDANHPDLILQGLRLILEKI